MPSPMYGQAPLNLQPSARPMPAHGSGCGSAAPALPVSAPAAASRRTRVRTPGVEGCSPNRCRTGPASFCGGEKRQRVRARQPARPRMQRAERRPYAPSQARTHKPHAPNRRRSPQRAATAADSTPHTRASAQPARAGLYLRRHSLCRLSSLSPCPQHSQRGGERRRRRESNKKRGRHGTERASRCGREGVGRHWSSASGHHLRRSVVRGGHHVCGLPRSRSRVRGSSLLAPLPRPFASRV